MLNKFVLNEGPEELGRWRELNYKMLCCWRGALYFPYPKDIPLLSDHTNSPTMKGQTSIIGKANSQRGGMWEENNPQQVSPSGCQFRQWNRSLFLQARYISARQPLTITTTSETRQEALKIKHHESRLASNLEFIDRKMLNDRWSL